MCTIPSTGSKLGVRDENEMSTPSLLIELGVLDLKQKLYMKERVRYVCLYSKDHGVKAGKRELWGPIFLMNRYYRKYSASR